MEYNDVSVIKAKDDKGNIKTFDFDTCPDCGGTLHFDIHTHKKHCGDCGKIWTFEIKGTKLIAHQWFSFKAIDMSKHYSKIEI